MFTFNCCYQPWLAAPSTFINNLTVDSTTLFLLHKLEILLTSSNDHEKQHRLTHGYWTVMNIWWSRDSVHQYKITSSNHSFLEIQLLSKIFRSTAAQYICSPPLVVTLIATVSFQFYLHTFYEEGQTCEQTFVTFFSSFIDIFLELFSLSVILIVWNFSAIMQMWWLGKIKLKV